MHVCALCNKKPAACKNIKTTIASSHTIIESQFKTSLSIHPPFNVQNHAYNKQYKRPLSPFILLLPPRSGGWRLRCSIGCLKLPRTSAKGAPLLCTVAEPALYALEVKGMTTHAPYDWAVVSWSLAIGWTSIITVVVLWWFLRLKGNCAWSVLGLRNIRGQWWCGEAHARPMALGCNAFICWPTSLCKCHTRHPLHPTSMLPLHANV